MRFRKVAHVYIVADTGTVAREVIITENLKFFPHTGRNFHNDGQKVLRIPLKPLNGAGRIIARRIKVSQRCKLESFKPVIPLQKFFGLKLGKTVITFGFFRVLFVDRKIFR